MKDFFVCFVLQLHLRALVVFFAALDQSTVEQDDVGRYSRATSNFAQQ